MEELIIKEQETREKLVQILNDSKLPACMLEPILKDFYNQIVKEKEQQYQQAKANQEQKKEKKREEK